MKRAEDKPDSPQVMGMITGQKPAITSQYRSMRVRTILYCILDALTSIAVVGDGHPEIDCLLRP